MKSMPKLIRRFVAVMLLSSVLLLILNITLMAVYTLNKKPNGHPWTTAQQTAEHLTPAGRGYILSDDMKRELKNADAWAVLIDNQTLQTVWQTDNVPDTVPKSYSACDIAELTRGYIDGYPAFTGKSEYGLAVLGYPKNSFWKHLWPSWDYSLIASLPKTLLMILAFNFALIFIIYMTASSSLLKSVKPIVNGIHSLSVSKAVSVKERGLLSELAAGINETSKILQSQDRQLRKKETARANWIAGVSHDIRTPLSMVMGYACQLENSSRLPEQDRRKAAVIVKQSERIKNLISDLNLASRLEYNMQPLHLAKQNLTAAVRQVTADFMNMDIDDRYPIVWQTDEAFSVCLANIDKDLIKRAVSNLIQNCINHNEQGCRIFVSVSASESSCSVTVADDGKGSTDEEIEKLNHAPHYMVCDDNTSRQRHGLGLLIVKQTAAAHGGKVHIGRSAYGGFLVTLELPVS